MATPHVASDTFICGTCQAYFNDLVTFLEHKRSTACGVTVPYDSQVQNENVTVLAEAPSSEDTAKAGENNTTTDPQIKIVKRRGRPRKTDKATPPPKPPVIKEAPKKKATQDDDGNLVCQTCKQKFTRERHFNSHKCKKEDDLYLAPEDIPSLDEGFDSRLKFPVVMPADGTDGVDGTPGSDLLAVNESEEEEDDGDETEDYNPSVPYKENAEAEADTDNDDVLEAELDEAEVDESPGVDGKRKRRSIVASDPKRKLASLNKRRKIATYAVPQTLEDIPDIAVFPTAEARQEFEKKEITVIDMSLTESMYKIHVIEQTMNEYALPLAPRAAVDISLYSCNTCNKVFKCLSHIRHHCLTHVDKKPFKCPECDFRTNSKGNVYSHMRKHTGQMYKCRTCKFETINKSHLLEHESTHSGMIHKCALCKKHYSTPKSLITHIRLYHSKTEEGKSYLQQFVAAKEGPGAALLFECHICDRKFKKQSDRDRHLYTHNVRVEQTVYKCVLCDHETSKQQNLDAHYTKHKYIYCCIFCEERTLSVQSLMSHLSDKHSDSVSNDELPQECIEKSLYLPETKQVVLESRQGQQDSDNAAEEHEDLFSRLGYKQMTLEIFNNIRSKNGVCECAECGEWFSSADLYQQHIATHNDDRPFSCEFCEFKGYSQTSLRNHVNAHHEENQLTCTQCNYVTKSKVAMHDHKLRHELMECPLCKLPIAGKKALRNHLLAKHEDVDAEAARRLSGYGRRTDAMKSGQPFKCPYCEKVFANNNIELKKHMWEHEGIKPFKCGVCDYASRTKANLQAHMLRHSDWKPYACSFCGKRYKSKTALRWHERSHPNGRLFKCDKCSYEAVQKSHLVRHMETHNILKRYSCNQCHFSANTLGYMRIHYTRLHPGLHYTHDSATEYSGEQGVIEANAPPTNVFKCVSCDYLFGNLSDMKRHLRMKHRIHIQDMRGSSGHDVMTQIVPMENPDGITSDVQVITLPMGDAEGADNHQIIHTIPNAVSDGQEQHMFIGNGDELNTANIQLIELTGHELTEATQEETQENIQVQTVMLDNPDTQITTVATLSGGDNLNYYTEATGQMEQIQAANDTGSKSQSSNQATHISILKTHQPPVITVQEETIMEDNVHNELSTPVDIDVHEVIADTTTVGVTDGDSMDIHVEIEGEVHVQNDS